MALNQNQFSITPVIGQMGLLPPRGIIGCEVDSAFAGTALVSGQTVKLVNSAGGVPKITAVTSDSDLIFGIVPYNFKDVGYAALAKLEIATLHDDAIYMQATAAIARGALVKGVVATIGGVATAAQGSGSPILGWAFDEAVNVGDLIRVVLQLPSYFNA